MSVLVKTSVEARFSSALDFETVLVAGIVVGLLSSGAESVVETSSTSAGGVIDGVK